MSESDQINSVNKTLCNWYNYFFINKHLSAIKDIASTPVGFIVVPQLKENFYHAMVTCIKPEGIA